MLAKEVQPLRHEEDTKQQEGAEKDAVQSQTHHRTQLQQPRHKKCEPATLTCYVTHKECLGFLNT